MNIITVQHGTWTAWGIDEKDNRVELSDSARYRMLGNGVGIPVVTWIGKRTKECVGK